MEEEVGVDLVWEWMLYESYLGLQGMGLQW